LLTRCLLRETDRY